ncbi:MAG: lipid-A-disaccharide synthase [Bdellovibrionia bacterium]
MKQSTPQKNKILIIAAEESSAQYGLRLLELWKRKGLQVEAFGIGNRAMESAGFDILGRSEELAVFGLFEIWAHRKQIKAAFRDIEAAVRERKPDLVLLMDYPGFNFRIARKIKRLGIPIVYFIPPQVWAWKQGRVKFLREMIDENLVLFPFEQEFYKKHGVPTSFVGHPLLDEISGSLLDPSVQKLNRRRFGIADGKIVLGLMPGSRAGELKHCFETQIETAKILVSEFPNVQPVILVAPNLDKEAVTARLTSLNFPIALVKAAPFEMIGMTDVILCASGTATLMVGLMEKPMIIMYRMNSLSAAIAKRIVKTPFFGLVNVIVGREIAPERFQQAATPKLLADLLRPLLASENLRREKAVELSELKSLLGNRGAIERVAAHVEKYFAGARDAGA